MAMGDDDNVVNGDGAMGDDNEVDDDGDGATGDDNDNDDNGNHDCDGDGDGDGAMGSGATGYNDDDDGDDHGDGRDDNDATTTMATAHQATGYDGFLKGVATRCRSIGHTEEAAKFSRRCMFAMVDNFGLNHLFLSTTPDDECSFRVHLYSKLQNWVSS